MTNRRLTFLLFLLALPMAAETKTCPSPLTGGAIGASSCPEYPHPATPSGAQQPGQTQAQLGDCESSSTGPWCEGNALRNTTAEHLTIHSFIRSITPFSGRKDTNLHVSWKCPEGVDNSTQVLIEIRYTPPGTLEKVIRKSVECKKGTAEGEFSRSGDISLSSFQAVGRLHRGNRNCLSTDFVALSVELPQGVRVKPIPLGTRHAAASFSTIAEFGWMFKTPTSQIPAGFPAPTLPLRNREVIFDFSTCANVNIEFKSNSKSKSAPSTFRLFY